MNKTLELGTIPGVRISKESATPGVENAVWGKKDPEANAIGKMGQLVHHKGHTQKERKILECEG